MRRPKITKKKSNKTKIVIFIKWMLYFAYDRFGFYIFNMLIKLLNTYKRIYRLMDEWTNDKFWCVVVCKIYRDKKFTS